MALEEKGRRYTLQANIKPLEREFSKMRAIVRQSTKDFRSLSRSLKFDYNNIELLKEKQRSLNSIISGSTKLIANLKKQIERRTEMGDLEAVKRLKVQLANLRSETSLYKEELKKTSNILKDFGNITALEKIESKLKNSEESAKKLNNALKLDKGNIDATVSRFEELGTQLRLTNDKAEILQKQLNGIDFRINPEQFSKVRAELIETKAKAKVLNDEIKSIGSIRFNVASAEMSRLDSEIAKTRKNTEMLRDILNNKPWGWSIKKLRFSELRNDVAQTKEKIKLMKQELKSMSLKHNRHEFIKLTTEIKKSQQHIRALTKEVGILSSLRLNGLSGFVSNVGSGLSKVSKHLKEFGRNFTLGYTLPVSYGASRVLQEFRETDDGLRRVAAAGADTIGGDFTKAFDMLESSAKKASKGSVYSIKEVAGGMEELVKADWSVKDAQEQVTHVMNLAKVEGMDLAAATEIVADGLAAYSLSAKDAQMFTDVLATASIKSTTDITKMGETLKYVAPVAGVLKYNIQDTGLAIAVMASNGIKASVAGTSLRAGLTNLVKPSKQAKNALDAIGFSMTDSTGKVKPFAQVMSELREKTKGMTEAQKQQFAATVFGKTAMGGWLAILNATDENVRDLTESIKNSNGATQKMADQLTSGVGGAFDRFKASVSNASYEVGKAWGPTIKNLLDGARSLVDGFADMDNGSKMAITGIVGIAAVIPPLSWAISLAIDGFEKFKKGLKWLSAHPYLLAFTALASGLIYLHNKFDTLGHAQKRAKEVNEQLSGSFDKLSKAVSDANKRYSETETYSQKLYGGNDIISKKMQELTTQIQTNYAKIDEIRARHVGNQKEFTAQEIADMEALNSENSRLLEERRALTEQKLGVLLNATKAFVNNTKMDDNTYLQHKASLEKDINETYKKAEEDAYNHYMQELTLNETRTGATKRSEEDIFNEYQGSLAKITGLKNEELGMLTEHHLKRSGLEEGFLSKVREIKKLTEEEENRHKEQMEVIRTSINMDLDTKDQLMEEENARHLQAMNDNKDKLKTLLEGQNLDMIAEWLKAIQTTADNGGILTTTQAENVKAFLSTMDGMDNDTKEKITKGLKDAGIDIDSLGKLLASQMQGQGASIMTGLDAGINSTMGQSKNSTQIAMNDILGIVTGTSLFNPGQKLAGSANDGINAGKPNIEGSILSIMNASKDKVLTTDFNPAGRKKSEEMAQGIKSADGSVWNAASQTANHGKNGAGSVDFRGTGANMTYGLASGASGASWALQNAMYSVVSRGLAAAKSAAGVASPARVFKREVGHWLPLGVAVGVEENSHVVANSLVDTMEDGLKAVKNYDLGSKIGAISNYGFSSNIALEHSVSQNNVVIDVLNSLINRINNLELKSDVYMDGQKVGAITYKEHEVINRRLGLV